MGEMNNGAGGNDFMVTLASLAPIGRDNTAGTFMHELGHTLGLRHGGGDDKHYKPNYLSVMNYAWQFPQEKNAKDGGLGWSLDYSPVALPTLEEGFLVEGAGLGVQPNTLPKVYFPYNGPANTKRLGVLYPGVAVDWDANGDSSGNALVPVDINYLVHRSPFTPSPGEVLVGYADWPNLKYNFRLSSQFLDPTAAQLQDRSKLTDDEPIEMTRETYDSLQAWPPYGVVTPRNHWPSDPTMNIPVGTAPRANDGGVIASDGAGGAFIAWIHRDTAASFYGAVYAQRIDTLRGVQWQNNGVLVSGAVSRADGIAIASDGALGAIIVWEEYRNGGNNLYAQRINRFGEILWAPDGVAITALSNVQTFMSPAMIRDERGGAIIVWQDNHSGPSSLYAQRIDASGIVRWAANGVLVNAGTLYGGSNFRISDDKDGGVIIDWTDQRNGPTNTDIFAQRVDSAGSVQWTPNGAPICSATNFQIYPSVVGDGGGGAIMAWEDRRDGTEDVYAQRINSTGIVQWTPNGVRIATGTGNKLYPEITTDRSGGAIIAWVDDRRNAPNDQDIYAQRIDASGTVRWMTDGVAVADTVSLVTLLCVPDNAGGAIIVYNNVYNSSGVINAQRIDSSGALRWRDNDVFISIAQTQQLQHSAQAATSDHVAGAIIIWRDSRTINGLPGIYAQNVTIEGALGGGLVTGVLEHTSVAIPTVTRLLQNYPNPFNPSTTIRYELPERSFVTLKIFNILGQEVVTLMNEEQARGAYQVQRNAGKLASGVYFYKIEATNKAGPMISFTEVKKMLLLK